MIIAILEKEPSAILDYTVNWAPYLSAGRTISTADLIVPNGITEVSSVNSTATHTFRLEDGADGLDYEVVSEVTLDNGQVDRNSILIQVRGVAPVTAADAADRAAALTTLLLWIQKEVVPPLNVNNIVTILNHHKAATNWTPNTFYPAGTRLLPPAPRTGVWYLVTQPGTSQSGVRAFNQWPTRYGSEFADGDSDPQLIMETQGSDSIFRTTFADPLSVNCYDVGGAARECVQQRLTLGAQMVDESGVSFDQITTHLQGLLDRFYPIRFPISVMRA